MSSFFLGGIDNFYLHLSRRNKTLPLGQTERPFDTAIAAYSRPSGTVCRRAQTSPPVQAYGSPNLDISSRPKLSSGHPLPNYAIPNSRIVVMPWTQRTLQLAARPRGFHIITREIVQALPEVGDLNVGVLHLFIQHTSASLSINENADPDVPLDLESSLSAIAPEDFPHRHTCEGPDDMPAHVKSSLLGSSLSIPIQNGRPYLGTWQGIYLCEHRNHGGRRQIVATLWGE